MQCPECTESFDGRKDLEFHLSTAHGVPPQRVKQVIREHEQAVIISGGDQGRRWEPPPMPIQSTIQKPMVVTVADLDISFGRMVGLLVKLAFAAVPAMFIVAFFVGIAVAVIAGLVTER